MFDCKENKTKKSEKLVYGADENKEFHEWKNQKIDQLLRTSTSTTAPIHILR